MRKISDEGYQPPFGESIASLRRREAERAREWREKEKARKKEAVSSLASKLALMTLEGVPPFTFEAVTPVTSLRRLLSPRARERMIPAHTQHTDGKSTFGGWVNYRKVTAEYLKIDPVLGYGLDEDELHTFGRYPRVITITGQVGTLLKPKPSEFGQYKTSGWGDEEVILLREGDDFSRRNCQAIWAPSFVPLEGLSKYHADSINKALDVQLIGHES